MCKCMRHDRIEQSSAKHYEGRPLRMLWERIGELGAVTKGSQLLAGGKWSLLRRRNTVPELEDENLLFEIEIARSSSLRALDDALTVQLRDLPEVELRPN